MERNENSWGLTTATYSPSADKDRQATSRNNLGQILRTSDVSMYDAIVLKFFLARQHHLFPLVWLWPPHSRGFPDHTQRRTTVGRSPRDKWSARRRDLNVTTHNTHNRQTSVPSVGFEPTISAAEWPQTFVLDRAASGTGAVLHVIDKNYERLTKTTFIFIAVDVYIQFSYFAHRKLLGRKLSDGKMKGCFHEGRKNRFVYVC